ASVLPMIGQPSSPGICVSVLRFGGVKVNAGEAILCIDMADAPCLRETRTDKSVVQNSPLRGRCKACRLYPAKLRRDPANATRPRPMLDWNKKRQKRGGPT